MRKIKLFTPVIALSVLLGSCSKNSTTATQTQAGYQLRVTNTSVGITQKVTSSGNIQWTSGFANPTLVKFEAKQNNNSIEFKSTNTTQIDLMSSVATSFGSFTLPVGLYNEIEVKLEFNKNGNSPALQLDGTFTNNSVTIPVEFQVNDELEIKSEKDSVYITDNNSFTAITTLDLSTFTNSITETMLTGATITNGSILISKNSNESLYNIIISNLGNHKHDCEFEQHHH